MKELTEALKENLKQHKIHISNKSLLENAYHPNISLQEYLFERILEKEYELLYDGEVEGLVEENDITESFVTKGNEITESFISEGNEIIFPKNNQSGRCKIYIGQHGKDRMKERNVSEREVIDAIFGAYKELSQKFKDGEIQQSRTGQDSRFVIIDARKNQRDPVSVSAFISKSYKPNKLEHPSIIIRTVYKGGDFSGATRHNDTRKGKEEVKIFLY